MSSKGEKYEPPYENDPAGYKAALKLFAEKREERASSTSRFQRISQRFDRSDYPAEAYKCVCQGKYLFKYRGELSVWKTPEDFMLYHQLFQMLRPKTIIELGTLTGGSAIWMADNLKLLQVDCKIFSVDHDLSNLSEKVKEMKPDNVTFLEGDAFAIEKTLPGEFLAKLEHPWLLIDDAHANVPGLLSYFHQHSREGDYLVYEDSSPYIAKEMVGWTGTYTPMGTKHLDALREFLTEYEDYYAVDSFFADMFGYNGSWHWNGFIRRMK